MNRRVIFRSGTDLISLLVLFLLLGRPFQNKPNTCASNGIVLQVNALPLMVLILCYTFNGGHNVISRSKVLPPGE